MKETWSLEGLAPSYRAALEELAPDLGVELSPDGLRLEILSGQETLWAERTPQGARLHVQHPRQLARAAGLLAEGNAQPQSPAFQRLELMWDCSRNAVPNLDGFKKAARRLVLMGYTGIQLYMEDVYEVPGYPYFGYMRGRYTPDELREMDGYASLLGLEVVPCIQTLAHLNQALRWPAFKDMRDFGDILLADCEETYALIDAMMKTLSGCLSSRRIHIGMDEAHMLGLGKYLDQHGYQNRMDIMLRHFGRVMEIVRRYGYSAMMWSDMFYRLLSGGEYYAENVELSQEARQRIPDDVTLVYWDYYSQSKEKVDRMLESHAKMCEKVAFAGGAWTWTGPAPDNRFSLHVSKLAAASCVEHGVREVLVTSWGDDGAETPVFDVLPTLQYWAEWCFTGREPDPEALRSRFAACTGGDWGSFLLLDSASTPPGNEAPGVCGASPSRYLTYQDLLIGLCDRHVSGAAPDYFTRAARALAEYAGRAGEWRPYFETQAALCAFLALKAHAGVEIRRAYQAGDRAALSGFAERKIGEMIELLDRYEAAFTRQWMLDFKVFGLEVIGQRLGGLRSRLGAARERLRAYLGGEVSRLEELETELLPFNGDAESTVVKYTMWKEVVSGCLMAE